MKKITRLVMIAAMTLMSMSYVSAQTTFSTCIVDHLNQVWNITNTKVGDGMWSVSGTFAVSPNNVAGHTVTGHSNGKTKEFHFNAYLTQDACTLLYDSLVWHANKASGKFQGFLAQWCNGTENPGDDIALISCKVLEGLCPPDLNGCGYIKQFESPAYKSYRDETMGQFVNENSLEDYFSLLDKYDSKVKITPNPAHSNSTFAYNVANNGMVTISVYNMIGQLVTTLVNANQNAGDYTTNWNLVDSKGSPVQRGNYVVVINSNGSTETSLFSVEK
ncbi:MAG: T9SS type A sorting domain-containing protein [Chitinophagales bacterium]|nr:T9SS type A sorting domain-containing protein [Chitinophagales bacterium]